jgi:transposase
MHTLKNGSSLSKLIKKESNRITLRRLIALLQGSEQPIPSNIHLLFQPPYSPDVNYQEAVRILFEPQNHKFIVGQ